MKEIQLTQGQVTLVDDEDFKFLNQFKWYAHKFGNSFYAMRNSKKEKYKKRDSILMHNVIMNGKGVDHADNNSLNNQKYNLRFCTQLQNIRNKKPDKNTSSKYKGVCFDKRCNKWCVQITFKNKHLFLGFFLNEIEAAKVYDKKAKELFGEFAYLNFKEMEMVRTKFKNEI